MKPVAIIGGGITGLTAAFQLWRSGVPFTLYEAGARLGGPIRTVLAEGYLAECGPNTIVETDPQISALVRALGLEERRLYSDPRADKRYIAKDGQPVALPGSLGSFIRTPLFSSSAKLRLGLEPFIRRSAPADEESIGAFVLRRLGREFLDYAINPLVAGVYAGNPHQLSVKHAFPKLHALEQKHGSLILGQILGARERTRRGTLSKQNAPKFSFDRGLEVLIGALGARMADCISLSRKTTRLRRIGCDWMVESEQFGQRICEEHSAVIMAIPAHSLALLQIDGVSFSGLTPLRDVSYPPVASVVLGFRGEDVKHPLDGFGVLVPEAERMKILGTIFSSSLFPSRAPEGHVTLTTYLGGARAPEIALCGEGQLIEHARRDLNRLLGIIGKPTFEHCCVFRKAIPQYNLGYGKVKELMSACEAAASGLFIGGQARAGISLGDSILSGYETAARTEFYLSDRSRFREGEKLCRSIVKRIPNAAFC